MAINDHCGIFERDVTTMLNSLQEVTVGELTKYSKLTFKGLFSLALKRKPARAARVIKLYGHRLVLWRHRAHNIVKLRVSPKFIKRIQDEPADSEADDGAVPDVAGDGAQDVAEDAAVQGGGVVSAVEG